MPPAGFKRWTIDYDQPCPNCSYSLRGLRPGQPCPECGKEVPDYSLRDERYLLHRAGRAYLHALVAGSTAVVLVTGAVAAAAVLAVTTKASTESIQTQLALACAAWAAAWWTATAPDRSFAGDPAFNACARSARLSCAGSAALIAGIALFHRFDAEAPLIRLLSKDLALTLGFTVYIAAGVSVLTHLATAWSFYELIRYRARRLSKARPPARLRWAVLLAVIFLPFTPFVAWALIGWRMRAAGVAALRAAP
ncbi:MAG: hypothetical protein K2Q09_11655 [Phycisphaerales bacterium]|nr:hypothetical protein [Phycisphaerales bacterium]